MNPNCKYDVHTYWGWFRLDEGAYRDYLEGKLWITWIPGKGNRNADRGNNKGISTISDEALKMRELAERREAYSVCCDYYPSGKVEVPYNPKMKDIPVSEMLLSVRSSNGLMRAGVHTLGKLFLLMEEEDGLRSVRNLGAKSEREIKLRFFNTCYTLLDDFEKAMWWQRVIQDNQKNG